MALVRSSAARPVYSPQSEITRLFNTFFDSTAPLGMPLAWTTGLAGFTGQHFAPAMDVVESDDETIMTLDLPGMTEGDVKVEVDNEVLTISGERKLEHEDTGEGYRHMERSSGSFVRKLSLPHGVDQDAIKATFTNGVLEVHVPKPAESRPRQIPIGSAAA